MKKLTTLTLIGASALALTAGAASAQPRWMSIHDRLANLDRRIDMGIRNGQLTRPEAMRLRAQFRDLERREGMYRRGGLTMAERADLDRRYDRLSARINFERHDRQQYGYGYYR
jgi:hypothetical protein